MKLTYWYSQCNDDHDCYSIITKTRKEANALREEYGADRFEPVEKKVIDYKDAFDLFQQVTGEGAGRGWGYKPK